MKKDELKQILLKEYELCSKKINEYCNIINNIINIYITIFFAIISACALSFNVIFIDEKAVPVYLLAGFHGYGIITLFVFVSFWEEQRFYHKKEEYLQEILFNIYDDTLLEDKIIEYLCIPRYYESDFIFEIGLGSGYLFLIIICNWISVQLDFYLLYGYFNGLVTICVTSFQIIGVAAYRYINRKIYHRKNFIKKRKLKRIYKKKKKD